MNEITAPALIVVLAASLIAAITDVWKFKVYNFLTFPLLVGGLVYHGVYGGSAGLPAAVCGALFGLMLFIIPYALGAIGAGDVKFLIGVGAWVGIRAMFYATLVGCLATGVYAVGVMIYHKRIGETWSNLKIFFYRLQAIGHYLRVGDELESVQSMARKDDRRSRLVPISAMMAVGIVATVLCWSIKARQ
jgi:prepilin peptidase CpaA